MDIMGLSKRMFSHLGQLQSGRAQEVKASSNDSSEQIAGSLSAKTERLNDIASRYNIRAISVTELLPLQQELKQQGFIQESQVRAQGLLTQLAFSHYQAGPMDLEQALQSRLEHLSEQPAVLADYQDTKHLLNVVRNLDSARQLQIHAA